METMEIGKAGDLKNDIPLRLATTAHIGTSYSPGKRGKQEVEYYTATLLKFYADIKGIVPKSELEATYSRVREKARGLFLDYLHSRANCLSPMITGPANFPTRRAEKANKRERKRFEEFVNYLSRVRKALERKYNVNGLIKNGDKDAIEQLRALIREQEAEKERIKGKKTRAWYELPYINRKIKNNKLRLARLETIKAMPVENIETDRGSIEINPPDNRIRIFFNKKPDLEERKTLKSQGFRWSPSLGAWSGYYNAKSLRFIKQMEASNEAEQRTNGILYRPERTTTTGHDGMWRATP